MPEPEKDPEEHLWWAEGSIRKALRAQLDIVEEEIIDRLQRAELAIQALENKNPIFNRNTLVGRLTAVEEDLKRLKDAAIAPKVETSPQSTKSATTALKAVRWYPGALYSDFPVEIRDWAPLCPDSDCVLCGGLRRAHGYIERYDQAVCPGSWVLAPADGSACSVVSDDALMMLESDLGYLRWS